MRVKRSLGLRLAVAVIGAIGAAWPISHLAAADEPPVSFPAKDADGRELNLGFEDGTLRDWTASGEAFAEQPVKGDTVHPRRADMASQHAGEFWVGTFERKGDEPQGTLTSVPFVVTHPFAGFLVAGGSLAETRVEIVAADSNAVIASLHGTNTENLERVYVDLKDHQGKSIFIRLVDESSGGWGHLNFDDFRFYEVQPKTAPRHASEVQQHAGLKPDEAAAAMTAPQGFRVIAAAGEPDVQQPIAMTIDDRGRLWVAEAFSYPRRQPDGEGKDRILIFEDRDGDGRLETRKVFAENLNLVSGIEVGFGGVFVGAAPYLLFIPDRNGDDVPDGDAETLLDGWAYEDTHETLNSFIWGPDGWLYGCHGVFTHSRVGRPGTPDDKRQPINAGIWRFHPVRKTFEVFAHGTSNPWGVDFDDRGQAFLTCCVIPHLFHVIQGGRYERQAGSHFNPYTFDDIKTIAKHRHWVGNQWNDADRAKSDAQGGGHAHAGAMIYLADTWPEEYRGALLMNNIHGARLNRDVLTPRGSGFEGDAAPDFLFANDSWSQMLYLRSGPDGNVFVIDWYDRNQCHHGDDSKHDRSNGRIFKIAYGESRATPVHLAAMPDRELVKLHRHANDWYVRTARRILHERAAADKLDRRTIDELAAIALPDSKRVPNSEWATEAVRLRALWTLHCIGGLQVDSPARAVSPRVVRGLADPLPSVRAWTVQLAFESHTSGSSIHPPFVNRLVELAKTDSSPVVRMYLASAAQRIPTSQRWDLIQALISHREDADDHNLPLLYWYGAEPLAAENTRRALQLAATSPLPRLLPYMVRRIGLDGTPQALETLVAELVGNKSATQQHAILTGMLAALQGKRNVTAPKSWKVVSKSLLASDTDAIRSAAIEAAVIFGDAAAFEQLRSRLANAKAPLKQRRAALGSLAAAHDAAAEPILLSLLDDTALRADALRSLASFDSDAIPVRIIEVYMGLNADEKRDALATLSSRPSFAVALLAAVGEKRIAVADLTADLVRNLRNLKNDTVNAELEKVWGNVRETSADKAEQLKRYKQLLTSTPAKSEDLPAGRAVFARVCSQCHTLFGEGGKIGPELTGSNRADLDYLLSNVLDPSAVLAKDYMPVVAGLKSGRVVTGLLRAENPASITLATPTETLVIAKEDIEERSTSDVSMMPDDLLKNLSEGEVRSLVGYLASPKQTPLRADAANAAGFFNGTDLTNWTGTKGLWRVEAGEIVGETTGLAKNEFLVSGYEVGDFRLSLEVKLEPNSANSGIQFRSVPRGDGDVAGYQADIGEGWWGKLYEEHGRGLLWDKPGDSAVKAGDWNEYEIVAEGHRIRTFINGTPCVDLNDADGSLRGVIALQLHSGGATHVRFRNLKLEVHPAASTPAP